MFIILAIITVELFSSFAHRKDEFIIVHIELHSRKILPECFVDSFLFGWVFQFIFSFQ